MTDHLMEAKKRLGYLGLIFGGFAAALLVTLLNDPHPKTVAGITVVMSTMGVLLSADDAGQKSGRPSRVRVAGQVLAVIGWAMAVGTLILLIG